MFSSVCSALICSFQIKNIFTRVILSVCMRGLCRYLSGTDWWWHRAVRRVSIWTACCESVCPAVWSVTTSRFRIAALSTAVSYTACLQLTCVKSIVWWRTCDVVSQWPGNVKPCPVSSTTRCWRSVWGVRSCAAVTRRPAQTHAGVSQAPASLSQMNLNHISEQSYLTLHKMTSVLWFQIQWKLVSVWVFFHRIVNL